MDPLLHNKKEYLHSFDIRDLGDLMQKIKFHSGDQ